MSAAGERIAELLDRWLASVELHERYLKLDDQAYAAVQDWPRHQRPTRWIIELARTRCLELQRQLREHEAGGNAAFADGLELMAFLTNLLGSEHLERFIPLADPNAPRRAVPTPQPAATPAVTPAAKAATARETAPPEAPARRPTPVSPAATSAPPAGKATTVESPTSITATVETPRPAASRGSAKAKAPGTRAPTRTSEPTRTARAAPPARRSTTGGPESRGSAPAPATDASRVVIADAVRLLRWGREWPELAGLIARLQGRPPEAEVWQLLRQHRSAIEAKAAQGD
jgi:hypothetical protein